MILIYCSSGVHLAVCSLLFASILASRITPVLEVDFPDPALVDIGDESWLAFATSGGGNNIQVAASPSFLQPEWRLLTGEDPLPDPGPWAKNDRNVWAPDVIQLVRSQIKSALLTFPG